MILLIVLLPVLAASTPLYNLFRQLDQTRLELAGTECLPQLQDTMILTQQLRGLRLMQDGLNSAALDWKLKEVSRSLHEQASRATALHDPGMACLPEALGARLRAFAEPGAALSFEDATRLVDDLQGALHDAAYDYALLLDWEAGAYFLAELSAGRLPALMEAVGRLRGQASGFIANGAIKPADVDQLKARSEGARVELGHIDRELRTLRSVRPIIAEGLQSDIRRVKGKVLDYLERVRRVEDPAAADRSAIELFDHGSAAIAQVRELQRVVNVELRNSLHRRLNVQRWQFVASVVTALVLLASMLYFYIHTQRRERGLVAKLEWLANTDILTGVGNRTRFEADFQHQIDIAARYSRPLSLTMMDLDHFKRVNDDHGHAVGDEVLARFAQIAKAQTREPDALYRWGGEEFALLSAETNLAGAHLLAERIRHAFARADLGAAGSMTVSLGITQWIDGESPEAFLSRADDALYRAKASGRNRSVVVSGAPNQS